MRRSVWVALLACLPAATARSGDGDVRLLTDDAIPRYLARGQELARAEQWDKVVDVLHRVVVGDKEVFPDLKPEVLHSAVYSDDGRLFQPARELCLKELARLPPEGLRVYRDTYDREARDLFEKAEAEPDIEERLLGYAAVYDRYLPSSVGDDALERAADLHLAMGRFYEALALLRRLLDLYPNDTDRDLAMVFAKAAFCAARIGDRDHRDVLLERLASEHGGAQVSIEGERVGADALKDHPLMETRGAGASSASDRDWPLPGGSRPRSRVGEDLPEDLPRKPFWSFRLAERDATLRGVYGLWLVFMHDREPSVNPTGHPSGTAELLGPFPTVRPIVDDGVVRFKDVREIVARRIGSGTMVPLRGRYEPSDAPDDPQYLYPVGKVRPGTSAPPQEAAKYERIHRYLDYGANTIVAGGRIVVAVESEQPPADLLTIAAAQPDTANMLVAYDRETGKTRWAWHRDLCAESVRGDEEAFEAWKADFQAHPAPQFQGPGVVQGGLLYTLVREREDLAGVSLWAIDLDSGRVRFRTPLHYPDEVNHWLPRGDAIAVAGGVVYVATHAGVVAAVDALPPGRVRWIHRYRRNYTLQRVRRRRGGARPGKVDQGFAFNEPVVAGGKVFVMAADADELLALDAETGRRAWAVPRENLRKFDLSYIVGVAHGVLVLGGDKVLGIDAAKGEPKWGPFELDGWSHGRGYVGRKYVHIPSYHDGARRSYVERFDVKTGEPATDLEFDVTKLGNILCVGGRLIAARGDAVMCFTTREAEQRHLDRLLADETRADRAELLAERALVALAGDEPDRATARADFRRSLAAAKGPGEALVRAYALENLFAIAIGNDDLSALAEAREIAKPLLDATEPGEPAPRGRHPYEAQISLLEARVLGRVGRGEEALVALERFLDLHGADRVVMAGRVVDATAAARKVREHLLAHNADFRAAFESTVRDRISAALQKGDRAALEAIPARYGDLPPSEEAYFALAELLEKEDKVAEAEVTLRRFIERFRNHDRRAVAHLRLARLLARTDLIAEARRERSEGLSRLDAQGRAQHADLIAELARLLPAEDEPAPEKGSISIPLEARPAKIGDAIPLAVPGAPLLVCAGPGYYAAYDEAGELAWKQRTPAGSEISPGAGGDPFTAVVAAALARARYARMVGDDLLVADHTGVSRVHARTGEVRWRHPSKPAHAARYAGEAVARLHADLKAFAKSGARPRAQAVPACGRAGGLLVRVVPGEGVEALDVETGDVSWVDAVRATPAGAPSVRGGLVAIGWSPGLVTVHDVATGKRVGGRQIDGRVLVAPPLLDPLGRVVVVSATPAGEQGLVEILDARTMKRAHRDAFPAESLHAAPLHADGRLVVFHDGSSVGEDGTNLHFLDLETGRKSSRRARVLLREVEIVRDGYRLFVLTHDPGHADTGARLFRVDLKGMDVLDYALPPAATSYARPLLLRRFVAVAAAGPAAAFVRLYDREASPASNAPQPVFVLPGGREGSALDFEARGGARFTRPPAVARSGDGLVLSHPFGTFGLRARDTR